MRFNRKKKGTILNENPEYFLFLFNNYPTFAL